MISALTLAQDLIRCPSVTPEDQGALPLLGKALESLGFSVEYFTFQAPNTEPVLNLWAKIGAGSPHLMFAGHTDVVPPGVDWNPPPFHGIVQDGYLHGRGASDMKAAIACFTAAVGSLLQKGPLPGTLSFLITGDEEGPATNGTKMVLKVLEERGETIDLCLIGEPSHPKVMGEMIKIGARGSLNTILKFHGTQGHVAFPELSDSPMDRVLETLNALSTHVLDRGNAHFGPSNLEITSIDTGNMATNVIPKEVTARFNIRFNDEHTSQTLIQWIQETCKAHAGPHTLEFDVSGESFITTPGIWTEMLQRSSQKVTGTLPGLTTLGGTSDGRFIRSMAPTLEFGMPMETMHQVNERVLVEDLVVLEKIYHQFLVDFFKLP